MVVMWHALTQNHHHQRGEQQHGDAARADAPPEKVEHPKMEIWQPARTDAIAATTPVSLRPASRTQIGIISS